MRLRHFLTHPVKYLDSRYNKRAVRELHEKFEGIPVSRIRRDYNFKRDGYTILALKSRIGSSDIPEEVSSEYFLSIVTKSEGRPSEELTNFLAELTR